MVLYITTQIYVQSYHVNTTPRKKYDSIYLFEFHNLNRFHIHIIQKNIKIGFDVQSSLYYIIILYFPCFVPRNTVIFNGGSTIVSNTRIDSGRHIRKNGRNT